MHNLPDHSSRIIASELDWPTPFRIGVNPGKLTFGNVVLFGSSAPRQLVVTNLGTSAVRIGEVKTSGSYTATHNAPQWLYPTQSFIIDVNFRPLVEGIHIGGVYVETNGAKGTEYAELLGYGYVAGTDPNGGESGSGGVLPKYWTIAFDGESYSYPIAGADVYEKLLFDTAVESEPNSEDYLVVDPVDYTIEAPVGGAPATIRFNKLYPEGTHGFTVLRGYAKPYQGPNPIETVAPEIVNTIVENNTILDRSMQNSLIVVNSLDPITLRIRKKADDDALDWKDGEFFSVMQLGNGPVTIAIEDDAGQLHPALDFIPRTRGVDCVISATCIASDTDSWVVSGDMLRQVSSNEKTAVCMMDRSVLIGSGMTVGGNKDSFHMPFGMKIDAISQGGLFASLMTAQGAGNIFTVDILRNGVSILVNKLLINNNTKSSKVSVTPATFITNGDILQMGDELTLSITQIGDGTARGLRVYLTGQRA